MKFCKVAKKGNKMEILAERAVYIMNSWCILAISCFTLTMMFVIICLCETEFSFIQEMVIVAGLCLAFLFIILGAKDSINHPVMEYKVRFVEKIDMEEFLDTYEIRDKDGSIITIRCLEPSAPSEEATN